MRLTITMTDERETEELHSLYRWLADDPGIVRSIDLAPGSESDRPGVMGPDAETITAIVNAGSSMLAALASLFSAVVTWQGTRPRGTVEVVVTPDTGAEPIVLNPDGSQGSPDELSARIVGESDPEGRHERPAAG